MKNAFRSITTVLLDLVSTNFTISLLLKPFRGDMLFSQMHLLVTYVFASSRFCIFSLVSKDNFNILDTKIQLHGAVLQE